MKGINGFVPFPAVVWPMRGSVDDESGGHWSSESCGGGWNATEGRMWLIIASSPPSCVGLDSLAWTLWTVN